MNHWGYLMFAVLLAITAFALMRAAAAQRTKQDDLAWQRELDFREIINVATLADRLAAQGSPRPGSDAFAVYADQQRKADHYR